MTISADFPEPEEPWWGRPAFDLRLDGYDADPGRTEAFFHHIGLHQQDFVPLAEHHTPDGVHSFFVLHDASATWGIPGEPQYVGLHLHRDVEKRTFDFEQATLPLPSMVQSWLIRRGCPPEAIGLNPDLGPPAADDATRALEARLMGDGDHFACGYSYTRDDPGDPVTVVALRALTKPTGSEYRVLVEEVDTQAWTHTLREGGFDTVEEAVGWCRDRLGGTAGPLPPVTPAAAPARPARMPKAPASRPPGRSH
ncbi:hypothetical protein ACFC7A_15500 [Streptomyces niveus]|uniref:hypothetical protein n=1 Tax=Streptomyces niveus TaxID=193462 RepID=UPI0035E1B3B1